MPLIEFQSTLPVRGATAVHFHHSHFFGFQSTLPVRGATGWCGATVSEAKFQSTLPVRGATIEPDIYRRVGLEISIHAPREGSDDIFSNF